jgi:vacuolar protein sorting-associated protein 35
MKQAMEQQQLPTVLERAAYMVGELGGLPHGTATNASGASLSNTGLSTQLTPKNYYELYMRALEEIPALEEYLLGLAHKTEVPPLDPDQIRITTEPISEQPSFKMRELYDCAQYCPRVLPRLYLQITAGSALLRSKEVGAKFILDELLQVVKSEQNPIRGLFLRHYLLTALRDKLPDGVAPVTEGTPPEGESVVDPEQDPGTVVDSYEFIMTNFMEMNKLWVRLQHLPGEGHSRDVRVRRARERNELRILVGTNLIRLSQLEGVTSKIYGESILPRILEHIVKEGDPLSQAYLMDCLVQAFPDEYHIETMPILLGVCPRLRDKVNIRTILLGLMDRLANYLAEEELLDESDTNQVKLTLARDSFGMFEDCVQKVYNSRGPKLTSKEVIRLQTALLQFSLKCYPGNVDQITACMSACVSALHQANASYEMTEATVASVPKQLDDVAVHELEKLLSIPLESLALRVLQLPHYSQLITFLPWSNRKGVAISLLEAVDQVGSPPQSTQELQQLFELIVPLLRDPGAPVPSSSATSTPTAHATSLMANLGVSASAAPVYETTFTEDGATPLEQVEKEAALVSKLIFLLDHSNTDTLYEMMTVARRGVQVGGRRRLARILASVAIAGLKLARRVAKPIKNTEAPETSSNGSKTHEKDTGKVETKGETVEEMATDVDEMPVVTVSEGQVEPEEEEEKEEIGKEIGEEKTTTEDEPIMIEERKISSRQVFIFVQETIRNLGKANAEAGVKMYLEAALVADSLAQEGQQSGFSPVSYEMLSQAYLLYEGSVSDSQIQLKCVTSMIGSLMACGGLSESDYETLITKSAQLSAKLVRKPDQCRMVALCAHLFFPALKGESFGYRNAQRSLECLQRSLKLADSCTTTNSVNVDLFVELLEHYLHLFEMKSPTISAGYITGLVSLIKEHLNNLSGSAGVMEAKKHFMGIIKEIRRKKTAEETATQFANVQVTT